MHTSSPVISNLEKSDKIPVTAAQKWESPVSVDMGSESKDDKIRLHLDSSNAPDHKGRIGSHFLLRQAKEVLEEPQVSIQAKRRLFRSIFEAVLNR